MSSNRAAWQNAVGEKLSVQPAPYTSPVENEIVIKNHAWAINHVDWILQETAHFDWLKYPVILGNDIAGEVAEVGSGVTRFKKGDRVLGMPIGSAINKPSEGGFQEYTVVQAVLAAPIPNSMPYAEATGGASAVGSNGIQLAVAAGYEVITTASPKNFEYVKELGASEVFDYNSNTIVEDLVLTLKYKQFAGLFHAAGPSEPCFEVVDKISGNKFVSTAMAVPENKPSGVDSKMVFAATIKDNKVGPAVFADFLPKALVEGRYLVAPEPWVAGRGLEAVQDGFEKQKRGVSARKVVVAL
ncbi:hypothetical protein OEA41_008376 [Lepraria neglecta]|uniref:Enoyl reductase (ER) domain-containing protein n=1 Tax=Lepraria neglecta TaxID=209136 RepID=A0AAD9ZF89_9LECA|nr:hypothetical protein OEA41_008376 [Lepraria neglecta]